MEWHLSARRQGLLISVIMLLSAMIGAGTARSEYALERTVIGSGFAHTELGQLQLRGTLGETAVGEIVDGDLVVDSGFWFVVLHSDVIAVDEDPDETPWVFSVGENYPNPFNPMTVIPFVLPQACRVILKIYDLKGREVMVLVDEELPAGEHEVVFSPTSLASGVYFYRVQANGHVFSRRMVLLK